MAKKPRSSGYKMPPIDLSRQIQLACLAKLNLCGDCGISLDRLATTAGYSYMLRELDSNKPRASTAVETLFSKLVAMGLMTIERPDGKPSIYAPGKAFITKEGKDRLAQLRVDMGIVPTDLGSFHGVRVSCSNGFQTPSVSDW
jgi:hypothetical protein